MSDEKADDAVTEAKEAKATKPTGPPSASVFKVLRAEEHLTFEKHGRFAGSPDDQRDGFIHLSTREQLPGTLSKHFAGEEDVVILALDPAEMGDALRWEPSRGGELFPHLYGALIPAMVRGRVAVPDDDE